MTIADNLPKQKTRIIDNLPHGQGLMQGMGDLHPEVIKSLKNMSIGAAEPVAELSNLVNRGLLSIPGAKKLISPKHQQEFLGQINMPHEKGLIPKIQRGAGELAGFIGTSGEEAFLKAPKIAEEAMKVVPKALKGAETLAEKLSPLGRSLVARSTGLGALADPGHPVRGSTTGAAGAILGEAAGKVAGAVIPPGLRFTKNMLKGALRKGYSDEMFPYFKEKANSILNDLKGTSSSATSNRDLFDRVSRHYSELEGHPKDIYGNKIDSETAKYIHPSQSVAANYKTASDMSKQVPYNFNKAPLRNALANEMKKTNKTLQRYKKSPGFKEDAEKTMTTLKDVRNSRLDDFEDADSIKRDINEKIHSKISFKQREGLYNLRDGLQASIKSTYKSKPELYKIWRKADAQHANDVMPFREIKRETASPFSKALKGDAKITDNFGASYIKPNSPDLLKNFMKILPDENSRKLAAYDFLKRSGKEETVDNPAALISKAKAITPSMLKTLTPEHAEEIQNMIKLEKKVPRAFKTPKEEAGGLSKLLHLAKPIMTGAATYGITRDIPLTAAAMIAPRLARTGAKKLLKTAAGRKLFMEEMEKAGKIPAKLQSILSRITTSAGSAGAATALSQLGGQQ